MSTTTPERPVSLIPKTPQETVKALLVIAVTLFAAIRASVSDGVFAPVEGVQLIIQAVTLIPVFLLSGVVAKTIAAFVLAAAQALVPAVSVLAGWQSWNAITFDDYAGAILAAMLAVGIAVIPNAPARAPIDAGEATPGTVVNITTARDPQAIAAALTSAPARLVAHGDGIAD